MKKRESKPIEISKIEAKIATTICDSAFADHVYLVGGVVRDQLLQRSTNDIDLVVDLPNGGIRLAEYLHQQKVASHPVVFQRFGTALIKVDQVDLELVMTRKEFYSNSSRKPKVEVGTLADDAIRRDFTINALYRKIDCSEILDLTGKGIADLEAKILRTTNKPHLVFAEDPLRMLRAIRFATQLDFQIESTAWQAIKQLHSKLANISQERIRDEFSKTLLSENAARGLSLLRASLLLDLIIADLSGLAQTSWQQLLSKIQNPPSGLEFRLALVLSDLSEQRSTQILAKLKFSKATIRQVKFLLDNSKILSSEAWQNFRAADWRYWILRWQDKLEEIVNFTEQVSSLKPSEKRRKFSEIRQKIAETTLPAYKFPLNGNNIKNRFPELSGQEIGVALQKAYQIWLENPQAKSIEILDKL
jgi:tRNA nucleotidyltransferase/poly(A) polymerase